MTDSQKEFLKRVEIKNIKTMEGRDGLAINCTIYLDGKKIAHYRHDGNGGCAFIDAYPIKEDYKPNRKKLAEINELVSKFPKVDSEFSDDGLVVDLDWCVQDLVEYKKIEKNMKKSILIGISSKNVLGQNVPDSSYQVLSWKGISNLNQIKSEQLQKVIENTRKTLKKGEVIFNTNL